MTQKAISDDQKIDDALIGNQIRTRRRELKMSQTKLGDHLGVSFQQIQKYERGANGVRGSRIVQLAKALNVKPAFFFETINLEAE